MLAAKKTLLKKSGSKSKPTKEINKKTSQEKAKPKRKKPTKKEAELELHPRDDIVVLEKDPLFETGCKLPHVSKVANSRLIFRAIYLKNNKRLTKLLKDGSLIYELYTKSVDNSETPYEAALKVQDSEILETILDEFLGKKFDNRRKNNRVDPCRIGKLHTGRYHPLSLAARNVTFIRKLTASRGSREGNNAFTESESKVLKNRNNVLKTLVKAGPTDAQLDIVKKFLTHDLFGVVLRIHDVPELLLVGQHKAAGYIIESDLKYRRSGFNNLFKDVLLLTTEDLPYCPPSACRYINKRVYKLSPFHCAAANPNSKYLAKLLSVQPDVHILDAKGRRPIHYAAGCSSPDTLNLLLKWSANISDTDSTRRIPLHYAIEANRSENVKVLLEHNKKAGVIDLFAEQFGAGGVNRRTPDSLTPLHYVAKHGFLEIAELLLKHGAEVNAKLSVSEKQSTPLMLASASGHLTMARLLVQHGAVVEQQDRMGCTALTYACKNGATSVLTYFLRLGARADRPDNSGNTPVHYAAAYGWLLTMRTLLDAGVDPNVYNMWRTTPVSVAYLKSHIGIVQELLTHGKVDINFTDDCGMSLLFHACSSDLGEKDLCEDITYMVEEKGASCKILDNSGRSPLHYLAKAVVSVDKDQSSDKQDEDKRRALLQSVDIAKLLLRNGCPLNAIDQDGVTAAMTVVGHGQNYPLAEYLLSVGGKISVAPAAPGECPPSTMMHNLATNIWNASGNLTALLSLLKNKKHHDEVTKMCGLVDSDGFTPLLRACYYARQGPERPYPVTVSTLNVPRDDYLLRPQIRVNPWVPVREFIQALVTVFHSDPNAKMTKKYFSLDDTPSPNSSSWWFRTDLAEKTPAHIVVYGTDPDLTEVPGEKPCLNALNAGFMFRDLVNHGANVNVRDLQGLTLLGSCINEERHEILHFLKTQSACDFNLPIKERIGDEEEEIQPLLYASRRGQPGCASMINGLIDCGSNINAAVSATGMKCLHLLVANVTPRLLEDILKVVDKLAEKGYDFNSKCCEGKSALHYALRAHTGNMAASMELEVKLLQLGSDPGLQDAMGRTALHYIFKTATPNYRFSSNSDPAEMTQLISRNMRRGQINLRDKHGKTALHFAAEKGAAICCMYLTTVGADPNIEDNDGNTPLALAVRNKFDGCASNLIQGKASLKSKVIIFSPKEIQRRKALEKKKEQNEEEDSSPKPWIWQPASFVTEDEAVREVQLYQMAVENNLNGVAMFITGADVRSSALTMLDAVQIAFKTCMYHTGLRLLHTNTDPSMLSEPLEHGRTLLHALALSCQKSKNRSDPTLLKLAEWFINAGLRPDAPDNFGCIPAQYAILHRHFDLANYLAGKHPMNTLIHTWTNQSTGIHFRNFMKKLIDIKIDLEQVFDLPLNPELVALNVSRCSKLDPDYFSEYPKDKTTALIVCINCGQFGLTKKLLQCGANPNTPDGAGLSPLMHAIKRNQVNFVKLLLDFNFDPTKQPTLATTKTKKWHDATSVFKLKTARNVSFNDESDDSAEDIEEDSSDEEKEEPNQSATPQNKSNHQEGLPVKKTSPVNLDQKDKDGRTALHYVARPHSEGTYDHGEMASLLTQNGCALVRSKAGLNPYHEAVQSGAVVVARLLKAKFRLSSERSKTMLEKHLGEPVNDGVPAPVKTWPDVDKPAQHVLQRHTSEQNEATYIHTVDDNCNVNNGELVKDAELDRYYDVLMTKVDVKRGNWGLYNFYQIQLVYQPAKNLYILFTRWGRIGDDGQYQHTPFAEREAAVKEFAKVFREKSGNKWEDINKYEQKPRKYRLVEDVARQAPPPQKDVDIDLKTHVVSALPKHIARVVTILMDPKSMQESMKNTGGLDTKSLPFGQLNKERLLQGQKLLQQIEKHLEDVEEYRKKAEATDEDKAAYQKNLEMIADLSNDYFHVIPRSNFSYENLEPLDKRTTLTIQMYNLSNLLHYQAACKLVLAAMWHKQEYNPVDFVYHSMGCKMQLMSQDELMAQTILRYIQSYEEKDFNVQAIFRLERKGEKERMAASRIQGERRLLWHGTNTCNLLSILHRGLVVSPPGASTIGCRYGKGIYFSDSFSMSTKYANSNKAKFVLLCEVAMGEVIDYVKELEDNKDHPTLETDLLSTTNRKASDTLMVRGGNHYTPTDWFTLPTGERLPLGKTRHEYNAGGSIHTQYVVRDPVAVTLRYLVQFS
ncbi:poly [ADP-ribose] polymerase [Elysia marginata]|uniref:Poly [ADP-ribose] polymerase n=1 Tax=Elysia marginata TaxID=1093978 RepID=A0AAV4EPF4_9GAST|nr:poly [ADP-ribose] polymerase [Elysia marginata]